MHHRTIEKAAQQITTAPVRHHNDQASDKEACHLRLEPVDTGGNTTNTPGRNRGVRTGRGGALVDKTQQEYLGNDKQEGRSSLVMARIRRL